MKRPVLILGNAPRVALTVARSLHRRAIAVDVASLSTDTPRLRSRSIRKSVMLPGNLDRPGDFRDALQDLVNANNYDMLIPSSDTALALVAGCYDSFQHRLHVACPAPATLERVLNKEVTLKIAHECAIDVPRTYPVSDATGLEAIQDSLRFPVVAKDRSKSLIHRSSFKVRYFDTFQELSEAFRADPELRSRVLLQEYCDGVGVGIAMLVQRGRAIAAFQHRRLKELPYTGGVAVSAISEPLDPILFRRALELLRALEWEGIAMVEFRQDRSTGRAVLMEVNGRYWGTCSLAVRCGIDFPFYEWQLAHDETPEVPESYRIGQTWRWTAGYIERLHGLFADPVAGHGSCPSAWRELAKTVFDFGPATRSALGSGSDPLPALAELGHTVTSLAVADTKRILRRLIPRRIKEHIRVSRYLGDEGGWCYLKLALARALRPTRSDRAPKFLASARSILFVCHGNIIRSPMAEALLKRHLQDVGRWPMAIASAGLHAKPGRGVDERALVAARELGISLDEHRSRQLAPELVAGADLIFVMDYQNEARLLNRFPAASHKVYMLGGRPEDRRAHGVQIPDPYQGSLEDVRRCYRILGTRICDLVAGLTRSEAARGSRATVDVAAAGFSRDGG